jgi:hypothetical protein
MIYVVLATRNGDDTLPRTLDRFLSLTPPEGGVAFVAVDNASTDGTPATLKRYSEKLPLTVFHEPSPGKNNGLNHILDALRPELTAAELVVFADDDIVPEHDWLVRLQESAREQTGADLFGGTILPIWPASKPGWIDEFADEFGLLFAAIEAPEGYCSAASVWGPNMAVRGSMLEGSIRFDPGFGPDGTANYPMGSETEFLQRLEAAGHRAYRAARAHVGHIIRERQLTESAILERAWRGGYGYALQTRDRFRWLKIRDHSLRLEFGLMRARILHRLARTETRRRRLAFRLAWHRGAQAGIARIGTSERRGRDPVPTMAAMRDVAPEHLLERRFRPTP